MLLCLVEALLIGALLLERRQRRQLDHWLADRLRFEMLSSDLSSSFINLSPADDLEKPLLAGLQRVTECLGADRGNLADIVADDQRAVEVIRRLRRFLRKSELEHLPIDLNQVVQKWYTSCAVTR